MRCLFCHIISKLTKESFRQIFEGEEDRGGLRKKNQDIRTLFGISYSLGDVRKKSSPPSPPLVHDKKKYK